MSLRRGAAAAVLQHTQLLADLRPFLLALLQDGFDRRNLLLQGRQRVGCGAFARGLAILLLPCCCVSVLLPAGPNQRLRQEQRVNVATLLRRRGG